MADSEKENGVQTISTTEDSQASSKLNVEEPEKEEMQTVCTSWHDQTYRSKFIYSVYLAAAFGVLGICVGQRGPSFLDLQIITDTDLKRGSAFFTATSVGYLVGSFMGGIMYDKVNKILLLFFVTLGMGVGTVIIPFCSPYALMVAIHLITALFMGGVDTCCNAEVARTWGLNGRSVMQTCHFLFALGGVISPLITQPFLSPLPEDITNTTTAPPIIYSGNYSNVSIYLNGTNTFPEKQTTIVFYAFLITGFLTLASAFPFLITHFKVRSQMKKRTAGEEEEEAPRQNEFPLPVFILTMAMLCAMYMMYSSVEDSFAAYLMTFVVKGLNWSKSSGTMLTSAYWAAFAFGRFCGIFFVKYVSSAKLLFTCGFCLIISQVCFLLSSLFGFNAGIWASSVGAGLAMAVFFPSGLTWTEEKLLKMTGRVSSAILISSSSGTMINPILLGYLMEAYTPLWFTFLLTGQSVLILIIFLTLLTFANTYLKKLKKRQVTIDVNEMSKSNSATANQKFI